MILFANLKTSNIVERFGARKKTIMSKIKVAAVICNSYEQAVLEEKIRIAIELAGGWPEKIKNAKSVLLKPNLLSARTPEEAVTTHPELVRMVIREIRRLGVKRIALGDSPAGNYTPEELWEKTGMKKIAEEEKIELLPFKNFTRAKSGKCGSTVPVLKELSEFDALISLPKLKTHILTKITAAVKNSFGLVVGEAKSALHADYPSPKKMSEFIAQVYGILKPDFVIMDAVISMAGEGPANGFPFKSDIIFAGTDAVAIDSCACRVYGYSPEEIPSLKEAAALEHGITDMKLIECLGDGFEKIPALKAKRSNSDIISSFPEPIFKLGTFLLKFRPKIDQKLCIKCGKCSQVCSQKAIIPVKGQFRVNKGKCILCMCCMESCPVHAIELKNPLFSFIHMLKKKRRS